MRTLLCLALTTFAVAGPVGAQEQPQPTLEERMSQAEFRAAGLDKLSPEELARLNTWLAGHTAPPRRPGSREAFYPDPDARTTVNAHIAGDFTGWRGKTIFRLDNGQEWQQTESGYRNVGVFHNPSVTIKPMILGSWLMVVEGCGCSLRVQRIK
ncbi:MAG: hypothetical protein J0H15_06230 [Xanthomonadales bacterium]|nr:hypothetical protein [Xanthomonadales bacterium]